MPEPGSFADRLVLITGASRGLGAALATSFAARGAQLILVARTAGALEEVDDRVRAAGGSATLVPTDLTKGDAVEQLASAVAERFGKLDVLIGNAGTLGVLSPVSHMDPQAFALAFKLNVEVNVRLIRAFDGLLRAAPAGRAIFVGAAQAHEGRAFWGNYGASKAALEQYVLSYAAEVAKTSLRVNLVAPSRFASRLRAQAYPGEDPTASPPPERMCATFLELADAACARHREVIAL